MLELGPRLGSLERVDRIHRMGPIPYFISRL